MALTKYNYNSFDVTPVASKALAFNSDADGLTTAAEGSMVLIKTLTASSDSTLEFVDGASDVVLDNTYPVYVFKWINIHPSANAHLTFNMSIDTGSNYNVTKTTTLFWSAHNESDVASEIDYLSSQDLAQSTDFQIIGYQITTMNDAGGSGYLYLFNPSSTTFVKHFMGNANVVSIDPSDPYSINTYCAGYGNTTSAVDAVQFKLSTGNMDAGTIKLYGIKDS